MPPRPTHIGLGYVRTPFSPRLRELSPTFLRLSMELKGHSALSLPYPELELIIIMHITIPLNMNKPSILILIRCEGIISKIILSYSYKITFLPLLRCIRQWKPGDIKEGKKERKGDFSPFLTFRSSSPTLSNNDECSSTSP